MSGRACLSVDVVLFENGLVAIRLRGKCTPQTLHEPQHLSDRGCVSPSFSLMGKTARTRRETVQGASYLLHAPLRRTCFIQIRDRVRRVARIPPSAEPQRAGERGRARSPRLLLPSESVQGGAHGSGASDGEEAGEGHERQQSVAAAGCVARHLDRGQDGRATDLGQARSGRIFFVPTFGVCQLLSVF